MIQSLHSNISSVSCSPIKPHRTQSFGQHELMNDVADWLETVQDGDFSEGSFRSLSNVTDKMHDGPLKTFIKILAIGGGAFVATKIGANKIVNNVTNNSTVSEKIVTPGLKFIHNGLDKLANKLKTSPYYGEYKKGFKPLVVNNLSKALSDVRLYGKRGATQVEKNIEAKIKDISNFSNELSEVDKLGYERQIESWTERKKYFETENLLKKFVTNIAGAGAGTVAVVEANKDSDGNGIADIGERSVA